MSFLGRFKTNTAASAPSSANAPARKDAQLQSPTALEKHLADLSGPVRVDGSDKFFGFENYSSTCYCNSVLQCLYYSTPFRNNVIGFPHSVQSNGSTNGEESEAKGLSHTTRSPLQTKPPPPQPGPLAANSPARKPLILAGTPQAQTQKPDEKDSPEWRKKLLMQSVPMLDMQLDYSNTYGMSESLFTALKDIFEAIISQQERTGIVSPHKFLEILRKENEMFRSAMHQDAHEFLNLLLNQVVDTVELYQKQLTENIDPAALAKEQALTGMTAPTVITKAATGWVHDLFEGLLVSETRCLTCENISQRDEAFMDLSVDLDAHGSVTSCLRKFSEEEMLCERNKFHCDNCGGLQEAEKRMKIKRLPRILAFHLKRFKYTEDYNRLQKLFHRVVYPFHLRLFNTTDDADDQDRIYELYAVVVHIGGGPYHGHYVSIVKTEDRGWLLLDDELVEPVSKSYVQNFFGGEPKTGVQDAKQLACAYVLFYQETTLEAMQKEEEADARSAAAAASAAVVDPLNTADFGSPTSTSPVIPSASMWANGFKAMQSITTPTEEKEEAFANLSHALTAPSPAAFPQMPQLGASVTTPNAAAKSKKDLKKEEKQALKDRKAAQKESEKAARQRTKDAMEARRERLKRADLELQQAIELSTASKAEEDARLMMTNSDSTGSTAPALPLPAPTTPSKANGNAEAARTGPSERSATLPVDASAPRDPLERANSTPLSAVQTNTSTTSSSAGPGRGGRFRHGSIIGGRRQKPSFWTAKKTDDDEADPVAAAPAAVEEPAVGSSPSQAFGWVRTGGRKEGGGDEAGAKERRSHRFSIGRKRSVVGS